MSRSLRHTLLHDEDYLVCLQASTDAPTGYFRAQLGALQSTAPKGEGSVRDRSHRHGEIEAFD